VRVLAVVVLGAVAIGLLDDPDALHIGLAVLLLALALWTAVMAVLMAYVAATARSEPPNEPEPP
jgi:heme A synthase